MNQTSALLPESVPIERRPLIAGDAITFYLGMLVWPAHLGVDYGRTPEAVMHQSWWAAARSLIPVALLVVLLALRRRWPRLLAGYLIFVAALLPILGLVPFDFQQYSTVADRYVYVGMLGVALAAAALIFRFDVPFVRILTAVILLALGARTWFQTRTWRDNNTLFSHALQINPRSWLAYTNLGVDQHNLSSAESLLRRAIELNPRYAEARLDLGTVLAERGQLPQAIEQFEIVAAERPDMADAQANLGLACFKLGRIDDAITAYEKIPNDDRARRMLPRLRAMRRGDDSMIAYH